MRNSQLLFLILGDAASRSSWSLGSTSLYCWNRDHEVYEEKESGFPSFTSGVREAAKKNIVFRFGSFSGGLICKILHFYFLQSRILQITVYNQEWLTIDCQGTNGQSSVTKTSTPRDTSSLSRWISRKLDCCLENERVIEVESVEAYVTRSSWSLGSTSLYCWNRDHEVETLVFSLLVSIRDRERSTPRVKEWRTRLWNITYISSFLVPQPGTECSRGKLERMVWIR